MSSLITPPTLRRVLTVLCVAAGIVGRSGAAGAAPHQGQPHFVRYFPAETNGAFESYALVGFRGRYWFTSSETPSLGVIGSFAGRGASSSSTPTVLHYLGGNPVSGMPNIVLDSAGTVWATVHVGVEQTIVRLNPDGDFTYFPVPGWDGDGVGALAPGPRGSMWFTTEEQGTIGSITPAGAIHLVSVAGQTQGICAGPNDSAWFTVYANPATVGTLSASGTVTLFSIPATAQVVVPGPIVAGPDGNFWFTDVELSGASHAEQDYIVKVTPQGAISKYPTPTAAASLADIVVGADGNLWSTETNAGQLLRVTPKGVMTEFPLPHDPDGGADAWGITRAWGSPNALLFMNNSGYIGLFALE